MSRDITTPQKREINTKNIAKIENISGDSTHISRYSTVVKPNWYTCIGSVIYKRSFLGSKKNQDIRTKLILTKPIPMNQMLGNGGNGVSLFKNDSV